MTRKPSPEQAALLRQLYLDGEPIDAIAESVGCCSSSVDYRARSMGLPRRTVSSGSLPHSEIVLAYVGDKATAKTIAARFGCSQDTITTILRMRGIRIRGRNSKGAERSRRGRQSA